MNQIRQNIRSTQPVVEHPAPDTDMIQEDKLHYMYAAILKPIKSTRISQADSRQGR
jgi:hypothetical protein